MYFLGLYMFDCDGLIIITHKVYMYLEDFRYIIAYIVSIQFCSSMSSTFWIFMATKLFGVL